MKRPGQTLGLYIREGNGGERNEGVFISRIALESPVYHSGCLHVSDEILAVNLVDVTRISLDDVVIIMSIPRRLVLTTRRRRGMTTGPGGPGTSSGIGVSIFSRAFTFTTFSNCLFQLFAFLYTKFLFVVFNSKLHLNLQNSLIKPTAKNPKTFSKSQNLNTKVLN